MRSHSVEAPWSSSKLHGVNASNAAVITGWIIVWHFVGNKHWSNLHFAGYFVVAGEGGGSGGVGLCSGALVGWLYCWPLSPQSAITTCNPWSQIALMGNHLSVFAYFLFNFVFIFLWNRLMANEFLHNIPSHEICTQERKMLRTYYILALVQWLQLSFSTEH